MGYLRGTKEGNNRIGAISPPNLPGRLARLERRIRGQAPEIRYFDASADLYDPANKIRQYDYNIAGQFITSTNFRHNVTGEKWRNLSIRFALASENLSVQRVRVIIYKANRSSEWLPSGNHTPLAFTEKYNPNEYTFFYDRTFESTYDAHLSVHENIKLNFDTVFDAKTTLSVTTGALRIRVVLETTSLIGPYHARFSTLLAYHDK